MARIGENAFRQYRDGQDRLTAPEYMAERELIRLAVNDLDDKIQRTEGIREEFTNTVNEVGAVRGEIVQTKQEVETRIGDFTQTLDQTSQELQQAKEEVSQVSIQLSDKASKTEVQEVSTQLDGISKVVVSIDNYKRLAVEIEDSGKINRAIADISRNNGGGKLLFPPRTYEINKSIVLQSNVELSGMGEMTNIQATLDSDRFPFVLMNSVTGARISNMKLDGRVSMRNVTAASAGVFIVGSNHCSVESVTLTDFGYRPTTENGGNFITISAEEGGNTCHSNVVRNCKLIDKDGRASFGVRLWTDWEHPIGIEQYTKFVRDNIIENNFISGFDWNAIELAGPATINNTITGNQCENLFGHTFIETDKGASYNLFTFNKCKNPKNRVAVAGLRDQGIPSSTGAFGVYPERIAMGNQWIGNEVSGIEQVEGNSGSVSGMLFIRARSASVTNLTVRKVTTRNPSSVNVAGIQIDNSCEDINITGGVLEDVQTGIYNNGSRRVSVSGMSIKPAGYGYYATASPSSDITLSSNTFKNCSVAINMNAETNIQVINNIISDSTGSVSIRFSNAKGSIIGNGITNTVNTHYGIDSRQAGQVVTNNRLSGCVLYNADGVRSTIINNYSDIDSKTGRVQTVSAVMPTGGSWYAGDYVVNKNITIQGTSPNRYVVKGWVRITNGSNNVLNTDWVEDRALTGQ